MMSRLLQQEFSGVLYTLSMLVVLNTATPGGSVVITIDGVNNESCLISLTGEPPCKTLDYPLQKAADYFQNQSIEVYVEYSHMISSLNATFLGVSAVRIFAMDGVTLTCSSNSSVILHHAASLSVQNLIIKDCLVSASSTYGVIFYNSMEVQLLNCVFSATGGVLMSNVATIVLEECQFNDNIITSKNSCSNGVHAVSVAPGNSCCHSSNKRYNPEKHFSEKCGHGTGM